MTPSYKDRKAVRRLAREYGMTESYIRQMLAIEAGEVPGDVIRIEEEATMPTDRFHRDYDRLTNDRAMSLQRELFETRVTEKICALMEREGVSRAELARRLGRHPYTVTRWLRSANRMTLDTLSDIFFALGYEPGAILTTRTIPGARRAKQFRNDKPSKGD